MNVTYDQRTAKQFRSLDKVDKAKVTKVIGLFERYEFLLTDVHLKKLTTELWELRAGRWRLLFGVINNEATIVTLFTKQTQKTPTQEIETAKKYSKFP